MEKLVYGGDGLSRIGGRVVLTPFVLPGEQALVEIGAGVHARLSSLQTRSPERVAPPCPYFGACGGCHYQHTDYEHQVLHKVAILRETLARVGKLRFDLEIGHVASPPWSYRNRSQFHVDHNRIGYMRAGSHELCPIDRCPISSPRINEALIEIQTHKRLKPFELFTNEDQIRLYGLRLPGFEDGPIDYQAAGHLFRVSANSFFQVNRFLLDALVETALPAEPGRFALDLYAGVGLFSLTLAKRFERVVAVESGRSAVADLEHNAKRAGVQVIAARDNVESYLATLEERPDFVLADPPRSGLGKPSVRELIRLQPKQLCLVACDPATLARDLAALTSSGFTIERLTVIDLFPQTFHIETVVHLRAS